MRRNLIFFKIADIKGISKERPGGIPSHLWNSYKTEKHFYKNFQAASLDIFNIKTRWKGDSLSRKTPENRTCTAGPREAGRELGRGGNRKRSFQRPLVARGDLSKRAQGQGWGGGTLNPERGGGRGEEAAHLPCPRLLHFPGAVLTRGALLTREWKEPGKMRSLAHDSPAQGTFPPQLPLSVSEKRELCSPLL